VDARVGELTADELGRLRLLGTDEGVPTLAAALDVLHDVPVMVELKQPRLRAGRLEQRCAAVLADHAGPWCVASFNPASVRWFRRQFPSAVRVLTSGPLTDARLPGAVRTRLSQLRDLDAVAPHAVSYDLRGLPSPVTDVWREHGGLLVTWTAVGDDDLARARSVADNVIFEHALP
jgi:glycerophosphoryl diester phosphodiesterase